MNTLEKIAKDTYPVNDLNSDLNIIDAQREAFKDGYIAAQQSQPMWREIEDGKEYNRCLVKSEEKSIGFIDWCAGGNYLLYQGYTHYLYLEKLLQLPIAQLK